MARGIPSFLFATLFASSWLVWSVLWSHGDTSHREQVSIIVCRYQQSTWADTLNLAHTSTNQENELSRNLIFQPRVELTEFFISAPERPFRWQDGTCRRTHLTRLSGEKLCWWTRPDICVVLKQSLPVNLKCCWKSGRIRGKKKKESVSANWTIIAV